MFKNVASQKIQLFAFDTTTGAAKTGDAANITAYVAKDYGTVTVLGDTSATEMDATNAKGWYLFDLTQGETNADCLLFTAKSSTSNISIVGQVIYTLPASFTSFVTPTNLTAAQIATGVWQDTTAGDFTTALSVGKSVMNGVALGTGLTINAYTGNTAQTGDNFARLGAPAGASVSADIVAINAKTTNLPAAPASTTNITTAALGATERTAIADAMLDEANSIETSWTVRKVLRIAFAVLGGRASGMGTATGVFRAGDDSKDRVTATIDASGNRTAVTLDGT